MGFSDWYKVQPEEFKAMLAALAVIAVTLAGIIFLLFTDKAHGTP
jgi:hypothetical protein